MMSKNSEKKPRKSLNILGFDSGSDQQIFIKYTQKAGHFKTKRSINQYQPLALVMGKGQYNERLVNTGVNST